MTVYSRTVFWKAAPSSAVDAELFDGPTVKATAAALAAGDGTVRLFFQPRIVGGDATLMPGEVVILKAANSSPISTTIPDFAVSARTEGRRIIGRAPPSAEIDVEIGDPTLSGGSTLVKIGTIMAAADGSFAFVVPPEQPWAPGDMGLVSFSDTDGRLFKAAFGVPAIAATIGRSYIDGVGSPGNLITNEFRPAGASAGIVVSASLMNKSRWTLRLPSDLTVQPGTWITTTFAQAKPIPSELIAAQVPTLTVQASANRNVVEGIGPVGQSLIVEAGPLASLESGTPVFRETLRVGSDGRFTVAPKTIALEPGWQVDAKLQLNDGFVVRATTAVRLLRVQVYGDRAEGNFGRPDTAISVTLLSSTGVMKAQSVITSAHSGAFTFLVGGPSGKAPVLIEPDDSLHIETDVADPVIVRVPPLSAVVNVYDDTVSGTAPYGSRVSVTSPGNKVVQTSADADGKYAVSFNGVQDLSPGMDGIVTVITAAGYEFQLRWVAAQMFIRLHESEVRGFSPASQSVVATVFYPDGRVASTGWFQAKPGDTGFVIRLSDSAGQAVPLESGLRVYLEIANQPIEVEVPTLSAHVNEGEDRVDGFSTPNVTVTLTVRKAGLADKWTPPAYFRAQTDANGRFGFQLASHIDLRLNDTLTLSMSTPGGHGVKVDMPGGGLKVDLGANTVSGRIDAHEAVTLTLQRVGSPVLTLNSQSGQDGAYTIAVPGGTSSGPGLTAGDEITVAHNVSDTIVSDQMKVPVLEVRPDIATKLISGMASPGGTLDLNISPVFRRIGLLAEFYFTGTTASIQPDGSFSVPLTDFGATAKMGFGQRLKADYWLPNGHLVVRDIPLPSLSYEVGGAAVCGFGVPGTDVAFELKDEHQATLGKAQAVVSTTGRFRLLVTNDKGAAVPIATGSTLRRTFGVSTTLLTVPTLQVQAEWSKSLRGNAVRQTTVRGTGPRFMPFYTTVPGSDCFADVTSAPAQYSLDGPTQEGGGFFVNYDEILPGHDVLVAVDTSAGYRIHRRLVRPQATVYVNADHVDGVATSFGAILVEYQDAHGQVVAKGSTVADADSRFVVQLTDLTGAPMGIAPGHSVVVRSTDDTATIPVENVDFDFSANSGLDGTAPPNRPVVVELTLQDGRRLAVQTRSDQSGRFHYHTADLPVKRSWGLTDIKRIVVRSETPNHHFLGAQGDVNNGEIPRVSTRPIYLPRVTRSSR